MQLKSQNDIHQGYSRTIEGTIIENDIGYFSRFFTGMFKDRHHLRQNSRGDEVLSLPQTTRIIMTIVKSKFFFLFYDVLIDFPDSINPY